MIDAGAAAWGSGSLYMDLSARGEEQLRILDLRPRIRSRRLPPPAWIYAPSGGGCGGVTQRVFSLDLDKPSLVDMGVRGAAEGALPGTRSEPLGPGFVVSADSPATVLVGVTSCHGNYEWEMDITYAAVHEEESRVATVGPFRSMGFAENSAKYDRTSNGTGYAEVGVNTGFSQDGFCST